MGQGERDKHRPSRNSSWMTRYILPAASSFSFFKKKRSTKTWTEILCCEFRIKSAPGIGLLASVHLTVRQAIAPT